MSLIASVREWLLQFEGLDDKAPLLVDTLGKEPTQYALVPLPGARIVASYIDGSTRRQFPFALQSMEFATDDDARTANYEFYEAFASWVEIQDAAGNFPSLGTGRTPEGVEVVGQPILFELGDSGTAVYQIQCNLTYEQVPIVLDPEDTEEEPGQTEGE